MTFGEASHQEDIRAERGITSPGTKQSVATNPPSATPTTGSEVPFVEDQKWTRWSEAIIEDASAAIADFGKRSWFVVHPDDGLLLAVATRIEGGTTPDDFETPAVLRWRSRLDGRSYVLMECPRLIRLSDR